MLCGGICCSVWCCVFVECTVFYYNYDVRYLWYDTLLIWMHCLLTSSQRHVGRWQSIRTWQLEVRQRRQLRGRVDERSKKRYVRYITSPLHKWELKFKFKFKLLWLISPSFFIGAYYAGNGKFVSHETNITYSGYWKDGLKDGLGSLFMPSGDVITGRWKEVRKRFALNLLNLIVWIESFDFNHLILIIGIYLNSYGDFVEIFWSKSTEL